jgi:hypothetical protein
VPTGKFTTKSDIYFQPMPQIEHNAPKFKYRIYWKLDKPGERWKIEDIADWRLKELVIPNQPTYQRYKIKVVAHNEKGEANVAAEEVTTSSNFFFLRPRRCCWENKLERLFLTSFFSVWLNACCALTQPT